MISVIKLLITIGSPPAIISNLSDILEIKSGLFDGVFGFEDLISVPSSNVIIHSSFSNLISCSCSLIHVFAESCKPLLFASYSGLMHLLNKSARSKSA